MTPDSRTRKAAKPRLASNRAREIAELAEAVADEHCPSGHVCPEEIAGRKGLSLSFGTYEKAFDGMLECRGGRFHIYCNLDRVKESGSPRARFTLAHELGHYFIDEHRHALAAGRAPAHPSMCCYESSNLVEQEADHFASNLLLPNGRFVEKARKAAYGLKGIIALSTYFQTSITSTSVRYAGADISPCAIIKWNWNGYGWKRLSSSTFAARFRTTVVDPGKLAEGSPTWLAFANEKAPADGYFRSGTTASAWFPFIRPNNFRNVVLIEEALPLGRFGVLTFLYPEAGKYELPTDLDNESARADKRFARPRVFRGF